MIWPFFTLVRLRRAIMEPAIKPMPAPIIIPVAMPSKGVSEHPLRENKMMLTYPFLQEGGD